MLHLCYVQMIVHFSFLYSICALMCNVTTQLGQRVWGPPPKKICSLQKLQRLHSRDNEDLHANKSACARARGARENVRESNGDRGVISPSSQSPSPTMQFSQLRLHLETHKIGRPNFEQSWASFFVFFFHRAHLEATQLSRGLSKSVCMSLRAALTIL